MTVRTVTVHLKAKFAEYLAAAAAAEKRTKDMREEAERLNKTGNSLSKGGLIAALGAIPGLAAPAAAGLAALPAFALSSAAAFGTLVVATNGVGDAMKAVSEGDADAFAESMKKLSGEAQDFVRAYEQVKPTLDELGNRTQDSFFHELNGSLELLTGAYLPTLLQQMPKVASQWGIVARETAEWASTPGVVAQVNRQFALGADLVGDFGGLLRSGTALLLDMADAGGEFARELVQGTSRGVDGFRKWLESAQAAGQIADLFDNAKRVLAELTDVAAEAGDTLFDAIANPALTDATSTFLDIVGLLVQALHGVLQVFELLPSGMQSVVATTIAVGAAVLILAGRVIALKAALESAKASALTAGSALKGVGSFMAGPWGIALTVGTAVLGAFTAGQNKARDAADSLRGTLDEQTGAVTYATRQQVANNLEKEGALQLARELGINTEDLTTAVLGGAKATEEFTQRQYELAGGTEDADAKFSPFITKVGQAATAVDTAKGSYLAVKGAIGQTGDAVDATTGAIQAQERAVKSLGDRLRAASDPAFALIKAQKDLASAQLAYTKAVEKHGPTSKEAEAAALGLAQQSIELADAVDEAGKAFDGNLTPQLEAAMRASGMTTEQINIIKQAMKDAKKAGDAFAKNYAANVTVNSPGLDAALRKMERLAYLNKKMGFSVNAYDPEGLVRNRWGGVYQHAATGVLRNAGIHTAKSPARYAYAEPATGGELFAPRFGDMGRTKAMVSHAIENWWGGWGNFAPSGGSRGGSVSVNTTTTVVHEHHHYLTLSGTSVLSGLRTEVDLGGGVEKTLGRL